LLLLFCCCCCNQRRLIELLSSIVDAPAVPADRLTAVVADADAAVVVADAVLIRNYVNRSTIRIIPLLLLLLLSTKQKE